MSIRLHPRFQPVAEATRAIGVAVAEAVEKYELTYGEIFSILSQAMAAWAKYAIRQERHPDEPGKKGDEA